MKRYIDKDIIVAEINRRIEKCNIFYIVADNNNAKDAMEEIKREIQHYKSLLDFLNTLEVKEIDLEKEAENFVQTEEFVKNESPVLAIAKHFFELGLGVRLPVFVYKPSYRKDEDAEIMDYKEIDLNNSENRVL